MVKNIKPIINMKIDKNDTKKQYKKNITIRIVFLFTQ